MKALQISDSLSLPIEAVTQTFAILAKRGSGKSYAASVMAEEMLKAKQQIVYLDPTGGAWGLRSGFPIVVMGGEHGDIPLEQTAGEVIAQAIVENRFSGVIDLSLFRKGQMIQFMVSFAETIYRLNREPIHLFVDEADAFAPQGRNWGGDENRMLGAMEDIVRRGRKRGIGCTLVTQRPAVLNKNVLTQCESLFVLRMVHPKDIDAIKEWINVHAEVAQAAKVITSLPSLPIGEAWFWSPGWMEVLERLKIRQRETFDSSATPKPGERVKEPKSLAEIDLSQLGEKIKATVQRAKENDPKALRKQIADLQKQLKDQIPQQDQGAIEKAIATREREWSKELNGREQVIEKLTGRISKIGKTVEELCKLNGDAHQAVTLPAPVIQTQRVQERRRTISTGKPDSNLGSGGLRRMLIALAQRPQGLSARQLGVRAGLSSGSGTFGTYLAQARTNGWIEGSRNLITITEFGLSALGEYDPLPTGPELLNYWVSELGGSGAAKMLSALSDCYPESIDAEKLGELAGLSSGSGTFGTYLSKLRTLELITGSRNDLRASEEFFE